MTNAAKALYTYSRRSGINLVMENRAARVCELCGEQYPPHVLRCLQDGEPTVAATTTHLQANKSPAILLGSFFAPEDLDSMATSHALAPIKVNDDDLIEELEPEAEEESSSTRRALKAVDFIGQRKSLTPSYEYSDQDQKITSFALKPVRDTIPPLLDNAETALVPNAKRAPSVVIEPEAKNAASTASNIGTTRHSAATDPGIGLEAPPKKSPSLVLETKPPTPKNTASLQEPSAKKVGQETVPDIDILPIISKPKSASKATVADVEVPKLLSKKTLPPVSEPASQLLKPIDPKAIDEWKIEKPLPSKVLRSIPLAKTAKLPSVTKRYVGAALLLVLVGGVFFALWSLLGHAVDKKEQLASLAPVQERVEISLR